MLFDTQQDFRNQRQGIKTTVPTRYLPNSAKGLQDT